MNFFRILRDLKMRYFMAFTKCGNTDFEVLFANLENLLIVLFASEIPSRLKLANVSKFRSELELFCQRYERYVGDSLVHRLKVEILKLLDEALKKWGIQDVLSEVL